MQSCSVAFPAVILLGQSLVELSHLPSFVSFFLNLVQAAFFIHVEGRRLYKDKNPGWNFPEKFVTIFETRRSKYTQDPSLDIIFRNYGGGVSQVGDAMMYCQIGL